MESGEIQVQTSKTHPLGRREWTHAKCFPFPSSETQRHGPSASAEGDSPETQSQGGFLFVCFGGTGYIGILCLHIHEWLSKFQTPSIKADCCVLNCVLQKDLLHS